MQLIVDNAWISEESHEIESYRREVFKVFNDVLKENFPIFPVFTLRCR